MAEFHGIEDSPISFAATLSLIGYLGGPIGFVAGALIGGVIDLFISAKRKKEQRKEVKKAFYRQLLQRYNTQIFISALERLGPSMLYLQELGLKPGSPEFDIALVKKLGSEIGYKGNCAIDLFGPAPTGQRRPLVATIDSSGKMRAYSPHIDKNLGPKWRGACKEMYLGALNAWAAEKRDTIEFKRMLASEQATTKRNAVFRILINTASVMVLVGYMLKQKKKLKSIRKESVEV